MIETPNVVYLDRRADPALIAQFDERGIPYLLFCGCEPLPEGAYLRAFVCSKGHPLDGRPGSAA